MLINIVIERRMIWTLDEGENRNGGEEAVSFMSTYQDELWGETEGKKRIIYLLFKDCW